MAVIINGSTGIDLPSPLPASEGGTGNTVGGVVPSTITNTQCGVSSFTADLSCANYYKIKTPSNVTLSSVSNVASCVNLYFDVISSTNATVSLPNNFKPQTLTVDRTCSKIYNYIYNGTNWIGISNTSVSNYSKDDSNIAPAYSYSCYYCLPYNVCCAFQYVTTANCCLLCSPVLNCGLACPAISHLDNVSASGQIASTLYCSAQSYINGTATVFCRDGNVYALCSAYNSQSCCGTIMNYKITSNKLIYSGSVNLPWCQTGCHQVVSHSVKNDIIILYSTCTNDIRVHRLSCLIDTCMACTPVLQTITIPCLCCYAAGFANCAIVHPFHDMDKCQTPAMLYAGVCTIKMWPSGNQVCPVCYVAGSSPRLQCLCGDWNGHLIYPSSTGEYILRVHGTCTYSAASCTPICISVLRDCGYNTCTASGYINMWGTMLPSGCEWYPNTSYVAFDPNLCHIFLSKDLRGGGSCYHQVAYSRTSLNTYVCSLPFSTCNVCTWTGSVWTNGCMAVYRVCSELNCAISSRACSSANGTCKGLNYCAATCTWTVGTVCGCATLPSIDELKYSNLTSIHTRMVDLDGNITNPYYLHPYTCSKLFTA